jgi:hypothetical protein
MATTAAFAGKQFGVQGGSDAFRDRLYQSICRLTDWLENNDCRGYDPFDGLNARYLRPLTAGNKYLQIALQQGVRRFPINLRPVLGIEKSRSTKGMAFLAKGFLRLHLATGKAAWRDQTRMALEWLIENQSPGYSGACWGNHFDYQSRSTYVGKNSPSVVWTSLIGHAFLDAYDHLGDERYLGVASSACEHIVRDLGAYNEGDTCCIHYFPTSKHHVHNANTLGASLLARTYSYTRNKALLDLAEKAMKYTAKYQRPDASWYYGEEGNLRWVDNFHTAYVLDCFKYYSEYTGDTQFDKKLMDGYYYWKNIFFESDGTPRYYNRKTLPLDIQCSSQAIDTLLLFRNRDSDSISLAVKVAQWTIRNMQDKTGYFYYRRYSPWLVNKTPTLHWGQATMFCGLTGLYQVLCLAPNDPA